MKRVAGLSIVSLIVVSAVCLLQPAAASAPFDFRSTNTVKGLAADGWQSVDAQDGGHLYVGVSGGYTWQMFRSPAGERDLTDHTWGFIEVQWYTPDPGADGVVYREIWWPGLADFSLDNKLAAASLDATWDVEVRQWKETPPWERPGGMDEPPDETVTQTLVLSCDWVGEGTVYRQTTIDKVTGGGYFEMKRRNALVRGATWSADIKLDGELVLAGTFADGSAQLTKMSGGGAQRIPATP